MNGVVKGFLSRLGYEGLPGSIISMRIDRKKSCIIPGDTKHLELTDSRSSPGGHVLEGPLTTLWSWSSLSAG